MTDRTELVVHHYGLMGEQPGGMAQVVNEYLRWRIPRMRIVGSSTTRMKHDPLGPLFTARAVLQLAADCVRMKKQLTVRVVHLSEGGAFLREGAVLWLAKLLRQPTIAHLHGCDFVSFSGRHPHMVRAILARADAVLSLTEETTEAINRLNLPVVVIQVPNIVSVPDTVSAKSETAIFCGEISQRKGADVLLDVWADFHAEHPRWQLLMVGPDAGDVQLSRSPGIHYLGIRSHEETIRLQESARIAVLPSRKEALPMFLLESMARRCVPIGTCVGNVPGLISDDFGRVVPPGDRAALLSALLEVVETGELESMGELAQQRILQEYSATTGQAAIVDIWRTVALHRSRPEGVA